MPKNPNITHNTFLENFLETIINENLNFNKIATLSKKEGIKGLTNNKIRIFFKTRGLDYDRLSKKWVKDSENLSSLSSISAEPNLPDNDEETQKNTNQLYELPNSEENHFSNTPSVSPSYVTKEPNINNKYLEELSQRISKQEQLSEEIIQKISQMEAQFKVKIENSLNKNISNVSLGIPQFVELSYSNGKRYEVTLREDLVNKAKEKLKDKYNLEAVDLTKLSCLFEIILFDYISSSI